jgi:hypothetical protein
VIRQLFSASYPVIIQPWAVPIVGGARTVFSPNAHIGPGGFEPGPGSGAAILVDPELRDDTTLVYDADGNEIADPLFIILGHELIHARHATLGMIDLGGIVDPDYPNVEEWLTIADTWNISENQIREEHGLPARDGHWINDRRNDKKELVADAYIEGSGPMRITEE